MIITTTHNIEGKEIEEYLGIIDSQITNGAGLLTEYFSSITDDIGGRSKSIEKKLSLIYTTLREELINKAKDLKADAIIGFSCDIDEINAKGKSMFMISGVGTAVKFKWQDIVVLPNKPKVKKILNMTRVLDSGVDIVNTSFFKVSDRIISEIEIHFDPHRVKSIKCNLAVTTVFNDKFSVENIIYRFKSDSKNKAILISTISNSDLESYFDIIGDCKVYISGIEYFNGDVKLFDDSQNILVDDREELDEIDYWECRCGNLNPLVDDKCSICNLIKEVSLNSDDKILKILQSSKLISEVKCQLEDGKEYLIHQEDNYDYYYKEIEYAYNMKRKFKLGDHTDLETIDKLIMKRLNNDEE